MLSKIFRAVVCAGTVLLWITLLGAQERKAPTKIKPGTCLEAKCHDDLAKGKSVHRPVKKKECDSCHEAKDDDVHKFTLLDTTIKLCYECHDDLIDKKKTVVHRPLKEKKHPCTTACHNPHNGKSKGLIDAKTITELCLDCHDELKKGDRYHTPDDIDGCEDCHDPHATVEPKLIRRKQPKLCTTCHRDISKAIAKGPEVHGPVAAGCTSCHNPHLKGAGKGLKKAGPELCASCHDDFAKTLSAMSKRHPLLLKDKGCQRCHEPHAGSKKWMLRGTSQALCLTCHAKDVKASDGRVIGNLSIITSPAEQKVRLHGPLAKGECGGCHEPHGNEQSHFLRKAYPEGLYSAYSPEAYGLCFTCHKASLAADKYTTAATNFRNGKVNLHFVHVNKPRKGRTCALCHSSHATKNPHFLRDTVRFGTWELPIGFAKTETGGSCTSGCHKKLSYDRSKAVKLGQTGTPASRPAAATLRASSRPATSAPDPAKGSARPTTTPAGVTQPKSAR